MRLVRDGKLDLAIVAGPRLATWPSIGVRALSSLCADFGMTVGLFGGESLRARGVIPLPGTGGLVLVEDQQGRIHRIHARAVVRISPEGSLPDPFPGWHSEGLVPIATAERMRQECKILWNPGVAVLGTGNRALRFASSLLATGTNEVYCIETFTAWGAKRYAGWEVERRRFERAGGKILEGKPVRLDSTGPMRWEFRVETAQGVRILEVTRVVSAGPFSNQPGVREYPPGSFLFELEQTAPQARADHVEGWGLEEERARWLAGKIVKSLVQQIGPEQREELEQMHRRARTRLKRFGRHREEPFTPVYQGKWMASGDFKRLREFEGVPKELHKQRQIASIECIESIPCNLCEEACPTQAIEINRLKNKFLIEANCTACGLCLQACPSNVPIMINEKEGQSSSTLIFPLGAQVPRKTGELATIVNRRGDTLGSGRVQKIEEGQVSLIQLDVPSHLAWEAREIKRARRPGSEDDLVLENVYRDQLAGDTVEITLDGEKRIVRDRIPVITALFETGMSRPRDSLYCPDGSCGLCKVWVDGVKKLACQTPIRRGMVIKRSDKQSGPPKDSAALCPCLEVKREQVLEKLQSGKFQSPEALLAVTHVGEGRCHGQLCMEAFRRLIESELEFEQWIDWRFPWSNWVFPKGTRDDQE